MPPEERPEDLTMPSYYKCPKCGMTLHVTEHYFPMKAGGSFIVEHVSVECKKCGLRGEGKSEPEAFGNLKER